jgi:hypothetical protein
MPAALTTTDTNTNTLKYNVIISSCSLPSTLCVFLVLIHIYNVNTYGRPANSTPKCYDASRSIEAHIIVSGIFIFYVRSVRYDGHGEAKFLPSAGTSIIERLR